MKKYKFKKIFGADADIDLGADFYVEMRGQKSLAVYGCCGIVEYTPDRITLRLMNNILTVVGSGLLCDSYTNGAVLISGKILSLELSEVN